MTATIGGGPGAGHTKIANALRQRIASGQYRPGASIPSTRELEEEFGSSPTTVQRAIRALKSEGLLEGVAGVGVFVRNRRPLMHMSSSYVTQVGEQPRATWRTEAERLGMRGTQELGHVGSVAAPEEIGDLLGVEAGATVVIRRRVMLLDDEPVQLADSYYPLNIAQGTPLVEPRKLQGGTIVVLEQLGFALGDFDELVSARMPTPEERQGLRLAEGVPVVVLVRTTYTTDELPVEVDHTVLAADRHRLSYRLPSQQ
ncbi:MAG: GntR family transcriptional regulator [Pseudonocardiaceae bacterium]